MDASIYNFVIEQGVDFNKTFRFKDDLDNYIDITGWSASLTARYYRVKGDLAFEASTVNGKLS